jgi:hypothetical protein
METQDIVVAVIVAACVVIAVVRTVKSVRSVRNGSPCCGCGATGCKAAHKRVDGPRECCKPEKDVAKK